MKYVVYSSFPIEHNVFLKYKEFDLSNTINEIKYKYDNEYNETLIDNVIYKLFLLDYLDFNIFNIEGFNPSYYIYSISKHFKKENFKDIYIFDINIDSIDEINRKGYIFIDLSEYVENTLEKINNIKENKIVYIYYPSKINKVNDINKNKKKKKVYYNIKDFYIYYDKFPEYEMISGNIYILFNTIFGRKIRYAIKDKMNTILNEVYNIIEKEKQNEEKFINLNISNKESIRISYYYLNDIYRIFISNLNHITYIEEIFKLRNIFNNIINPFIEFMNTLNNDPIVKEILFKYYSIDDILEKYFDKYVSEDIVKNKIHKLYYGMIDLEDIDTIKRYVEEYFNLGVIPSEIYEHINNKTIIKYRNVLHNLFMYNDMGYTKLQFKDLFIFFNVIKYYKYFINPFNPYFQIGIKIENRYIDINEIKFITEIVNNISEKIIA